MPDLNATLDVGGVPRTYTVHVPEGPHDAPWPMLVVLHGRNLTGPELQLFTHFSAIADREGFAAVYPDGYERTWNDGRGNTAAGLAEVDDVGFIRSLIDDAARVADCDPARVGAAGISNGAVMCHRLGLELSDRISAIAAVAGTMPTPVVGMTPSHAVSVLLIHGTADRFMPFEGGLGSLGGAPLLSATDTVERWRAIDGCVTATRIEPLRASLRDRTRVERWSSKGRGGAAVEYWIVHRGGHTWPGGPTVPLLGRTSTHFDASSVILDFVAQHFEPSADRRLASAETGQCAEGAAADG